MKKVSIVVTCLAFALLSALFVKGRVAAVRTAQAIVADTSLSARYSTKAECEAALQKNPNDIKALRGMVYVYQQEFNKPKAWEWMQRDLRVEPENKESQLMYALMLNEYKSRTDEALVILDRLAAQRENPVAADTARIFATKIRQQRGATSK